MVCYQHHTRNALDSPQKSVQRSVSELSEALKALVVKTTEEIWAKWERECIPTW